MSTVQKRKWSTNPWLLAIVPVILGPLLTMPVDAMKARPLWTTLAQCWYWFWGQLISFLNYNIRVWWLLVGFFSLLILRIVASFFRSDPSTSNRKSDAPSFTSYKEDVFIKWKWKWRWEYKASKGAWCPVDITPYCPKCHSKLMDRSSSWGPQYECPRCDFRATEYTSEDPDKIGYLIIDNLDRSEGKQQQNS
jgi:hypothetical protein